ncbi:MAG: hypothetical protein Q8L37_05150 [Candidatus Gottesmanbacteria bacterium]|nr:hypothetical protein [Candidatus Gottesmanbacteria bacterium]
MSDVALVNESGVSTSLKDLAKPALAPVHAVETSVPSESTLPVTKKNARETLQAIAAGPKEEATPEAKAGLETSDKSKVNQPEQTQEREANKEKLDNLFTQSAKLLLDKKDPLVVTVALARASGSTPLGTELRQDVAHMMTKLDGSTFEPNEREQLIKIQEEIRLLNVPVTDAARSEFANTLEAYGAGNPDKGITPALVEQVRTNVQSRPDGITNLMKADSTLTARLMTELNGDSKEPFPNIGTPEGLVKAAGLDMTPEHHEKAAEILRPKYALPQKEQANIVDMILPTALATSMTLMFIASLAGAGGQEGGGH